MWKWNTEYIIEDDFLEQRHFEFLKNLKFEKSTGYALLSHSVDREGNIFLTTNTIPNDLLTDFVKTYTPKLLNYLDRLRPELKESYTFSDIAVVAIRGNRKFPIHTDLPNKSLSVVVYISPEDNTGTILYRDKKGKDKYTVEWKPNRALLFSRTNNSWHSYNSSGNSLRVVLVYNLRNDNIEKVKKIHEERLLIKSQKQINQKNNL
jgi:hypothetical protein